MEEVGREPAHRVEGATPQGEPAWTEDWQIRSGRGDLLEGTKRDTCFLAADGAHTGADAEMRPRAGDPLPVASLYIPGKVHQREALTTQGCKMSLFCRGED